MIKIITLSILLFFIGEESYAYRKKELGKIHFQSTTFPDRSFEKLPSSHQPSLRSFIDDGDQDPLEGGSGEDDPNGYNDSALPVKDGVAVLLPCILGYIGYIISYSKNKNKKL